MALQKSVPTTPINQTFIPIKPIPLARPRFNRRTGAVYTPYACQAYKRQFAQAYKRISGQIEPHTGPLEVFVRFYLKKPKALKSTYHVKRPDTDNLIKALLDALNGVAWLDDSQIWNIHAQKVYVKEVTQQGTEVTIAPTEE